MARHRSPQGRRAHLGLPLPPTPAAAGAGVAHPVPSLPFTGISTPVRMVATAIAGSALAAAGQVALTDAMSFASDGTNVLRLGVEQLVGTGAELPGATPEVARVIEPLAAVTPVASEPIIADAASLVKAADLQRVAAEEAARAAEAEAARIAEESRLAELARVASETVTAAGGGIQMIVGRITSGFGARWGSQHQGLDIAAPIGTPIRVPLAGTVISSGPASGFGLWVRVRHEDGTITVYGHINRSLVSVGQSVSAGEEIAEVGNRGESTGPHLHFEVVTPGGTKINPRPWLDERGIGLT